MYMDIEFSNAKQIADYWRIDLVYGNDNKSYWYTDLHQ
jgi:hypothetical protein